MYFAEQSAERILLIALERKLSQSTVDLAGVESRLSEAKTVADALIVLQSAYEIEFITYHLASTVVGDIDAPFVRTTYPDSWVSRYLLSGHVRIDPVVREGFLRQFPFDWADLDVTPESLAFFDDASRHGVARNGFSIPVTDKVGRRAILSFNTKTSATDWERIVHRHRSDWLRSPISFIGRRFWNSMVKSTLSRHSVAGNGNAFTGAPSERITRTLRSYSASPAIRRAATSNQPGRSSAVRRSRQLPASP